MTNQVISLINKIIKENGINKYSENWQEMDPKFNFLNLNQCLNYIISNLKLYHKHSNLLYYQNTNIIELKKDNRKPPKFIWDNKNKIGRIIYYHFYSSTNKLKNTNDEKDMIFLTNKYLDQWLKNNIKGLIIDLRFHKGGNFYPFIMSLVRILDKTTLFGINQDNKKIWFNLNDKIEIGEFKTEKLSFKKPLAIIIGENTKSSGEFSAAIFKGRDNVKFFGQKTAGFLSMNSTIKINSKLKLILPTNLITTVDNVFQESEILVPDIITRKPISDSKNWINKINYFNIWFFFSVGFIVKLFKFIL